MNNVNIALAQINTVSGNIKENTKTIITAIRKAKSQNVEVIVFPELAVSGYGAHDLFLKSEFLETAKKAIDTISKECTDGLIALVGFPEKNKKGCFNSVAILAEGKILGVHQKRTLPNLELFAENRYFKLGNSPTTIKVKNLTIGITISEEIFEEELIPKCDVLCCLGALPWSRDHSIEREQLFHHITRLHHTPLIFVNTVSIADDLLLEGGSCVINKAGNAIVRLSSFKEDFSVVSTGTFDVLDDQLRSTATIRNTTEDIYNALLFSLREFTQKLNRPTAALYLDHSLESRFMLALAVEALGAKNVTALHLSSELDLPSYQEEASILAKKLGVHLVTQPTNDAAIDKVLVDLTNYAHKQHDLTWRSNTIDRYKSATFLSFAELIEAIPLGSTNKTQISLGIKTFAGSFTKANFMPLLDLYHRKIIKLAEYLNMRQEFFTPEEIRAAYVMKIKHPKINNGEEIILVDADEILYRYIEGNQSVQQIIKSGFEADIVISLLKTLHEAEGIRKQIGYGPKMSVRSFSNDWRFPAAAHWDSMDFKSI